MDNKKTSKTIGVWLDHHQAHLIDLNNGKIDIETMQSGLESQYREDGQHGDGVKLGNGRSTNNEYRKHNIENALTNKYYDLLADKLSGYENILLFGPTTAKDELHNKLAANHQFAGKYIRTATAGKITQNQMVEQVKRFFKH